MSVLPNDSLVEVSSQRKDKFITPLTLMYTVVSGRWYSQWAFSESNTVNDRRSQWCSLKLLLGVVEAIGTLHILFEHMFH